MRYFIDCEFDGHNGPLLSIALVRNDGQSIHIETTAIASDPWVLANVVPLMSQNDATTHPLVQPHQVGPMVRQFIGGDAAPVIIADSPVDIGRFCYAVMTDSRGEYAPNNWPVLSFEVHDVDCYPTDIPGAVQHNAWWDAMALRHKLATSSQGGDLVLVPKRPTDGMLEASANEWTRLCHGYPPEDGHYKFMRALWQSMLEAVPTTPSQGLDAATVERCAVRKAVRDAWFDGRSTRGSQYDSEAVEAKWDRLVDRALATEPHQHGGKGA